MTDPEIALFMSYLNKASSYLEYGCGGSTYIAVQIPTINKIISVEGNKRWINKCREINILSHAEKCGRLSFRHVEYNATDNWSHPQSMNDKHLFPPYSEPPSEHNDLVLIDGRFRVACGLKLWKNISTNTIVIVHDYLDRPQYHILDQFYERIDSVDTLVVFRKKVNADDSHLSTLIAKYEIDPA